MTDGRRIVFLSLTLLVVSSLCVVFASAVTGPSFAEVERIDTVDAAKALVVEVSQQGPSAFTARNASGIYERARRDGVPNVLLSAWAVLAMGPSEAMDELTLYRSGWLAVTAIAPMALFWIAERSYGRWVALLASALLLITPSWLHAASVGEPAAVTATFWLLLSACYVRSLQGKRRTCWAVAFSAGLGVALACDRSAIWIVAPLLLHFAILRRRSLRTDIARGRLPLPAAALFATVVTPVALILVSPQLWKPGTRAVLNWLLSPMRDTAAQVLYRGKVVGAAHDAPAYAIHWVLATTPILLLVLAAFGAWSIGRKRVDARRPRDALRTGVLVAVVPSFALFVLPLLPELITPFPAPAVVAVPFVALLAAVGLERAAIQAMPERAQWLASVVTTLLGAIWLRDLPTISVSYNWLAGGTSGVAEHKTFALGDGSELSVVAADLDARGLRSVKVVPKDVPSRYFDVLAATGRMKTRLEIVPREGRADVTLLRGRRRQSGTASVTRDGVPIWTVTDGG